MYKQTPNLQQYIETRLLIKYLYLLINAFEFFNEGCNPPFPDLTEESNPVVVKLKLKR